MLVENLKAITGVLSLLSLAAFLSLPMLADAADLRFSARDKTPYLLSQSEKPNPEKGKTQLNLSNYLLGTVVGQTGDIFSVKLEDGTLFSGTHPKRYLYLRANKIGANVLVEKDDGNYRIVDFARPYWINKLQQNNN